VSVKYTVDKIPLGLLFAPLDIPADDCLASNAVDQAGGTIAPRTTGHADCPPADPSAGQVDHSGMYRRRAQPFGCGDTGVR
jgi:hypothetical protein